MLETGKLPNLRRLIVPDEGFDIIDMDLERADLYVVAWDSGCRKLQERLRSMDVHTYHADQFLGDHAKHQRDLMKRMVHAGNYLVGPRTASMQTGLPEAKVKEFLSWYYSEYPEITKWHERIKNDLYRERMVRNRFGYRLPLTDRLDSFLTKAVAFIPQSTVGIVINKCLDAIIRDVPIVHPLLQVHDSLTLQVPSGDLRDIISQLRSAARVEVPYDPPLVIPVSFKVSSLSWGDVKDYKPADEPLQT